MKLLPCILIAIVLSSCSSKKITYTYNDTIVTRVDHEGEIYLYYGDSKEDKKRQPFVKAQYSGLNNGVDAYLFFNKDGTVEVVSALGYFSESENTNRKIYLKRYDNGIFDSVVTSHETLIRISENIEFEKKKNLEYGSRVKAIYP